MPLTDYAYFDGRNLPRCTATPGPDDVAANRLMRRDTWECALPADHDRFPDRRHHPHSWVQTAEDE